MTDIPDDVFDEVERALKGMVAEYNRIHWLQTADYHSDNCTCLRCWRDRQEAALARLREARGK